MENNCKIVQDLLPTYIENLTSEETTKFIIQKCQEAVDENIWYTQEEVIDALDKLEEENNKCTELLILREQK